jgi:hypothetical protein
MVPPKNRAKLAAGTYVQSTLQKAGASDADNKAITMPVMNAINKWFMERTLHPKEALRINGCGS